jgi:predicted metal-dependent peptidase
MTDKKDKKKVFRTPEEMQKILSQEAVAAEIQKKHLYTAIFQISKSNTFMGSVLQCMNIMYTHMLPTAGVMFNAEVKRWDLLINPYFFCVKLNEEQRRAVLLHELYHIVHKHPLRIPFLKLSPHKRKLMNVAMDMAINQFIKYLPDGCPECPPPMSGEPCSNVDCCGRGIFIRDFYDEDEKTGKKTPWKELQSAEFYYEKLCERFEDPDPQNNGEGEGEGQGEGDQGNAGGGAQSGDVPDTTDVHHWDGSAEEGEMLEATEDLVKRAQYKCRFSYDQLPDHVKELLDHIESRRADLNYRAIILSAMKARLPSNTRKSSWTRKSKRFGNQAPGTKNGKQPKLDNYIDTSGSISVEEANEFLDIVDEFLRVGARECMLNMFHTSNYYREKYKRGQRIKREEIESGGTDLQDSFKTIAKSKPDLAIILTDGYFSGFDVQSDDYVGYNGKFPNTVFIISKDGTENHPFKDENWAMTVKIPGGHK